MIINTDPKFLKDLFCFCGKPATIAWHTGLRERGPKKMSKTESEEEIEIKIQPHGWCCSDSHQPK